MVLVQTIKITYKELFTVAISHPSFEITYKYKEPVTNIEKTLTGSSIFNVISVEPDSLTKELFTNYCMDYKCSNNMLICFVRTRLQKPYISIPGDVNIRFMIYAQSIFLSQTDVEAAGSNKVYDFTNVGRTGTAGNRFITTDATGVDSNDLKNIDDIKPEKNCFAVIDVLANVTDANYRLFNAGNLESPGYKILFNKK